MFFNKQKQVCKLEECKKCNQIPEKLKKCKSCGQRIICKGCFYKGEDFCGPCNDRHIKYIEKRNNNYRINQEQRKRRQEQNERRAARDEFGMAGGNAYVFAHYHHVEQAGVVV